jgi:nitrogen regulatory protein P-II 1
MKKIEAIIRPEKLGDVLRSLEKVGYSGISVTEIQGHGKQKGVTQQWRGERYKVDLLPKMKIEIVTKDSDAVPLAQAIAEIAKTGEIGDGKIFIYTVDYCQRIRTGEVGESAL